MQGTWLSLLTGKLFPLLERVWEVKLTVATLRYFPVITLLCRQEQILYMLLQNSHGLRIVLQSAVTAENSQPSAGVLAQR